MPELPEIEHLRRTLEPWLVGARVKRVLLHRRGVVRIANSRKARRGVRSRDLLEGATICEVLRRGKSLAIIADDGRVLVTHMGMTGSLCVRETDDETERPTDQAPARDKHVHCEWVLERAAVNANIQRGNGNPALSLDRAFGIARSLPAEGTGERFQLAFRDPRRFGGLWPFESIDELHARGWSHLGPDALHPPLTWRRLRERLMRTRQPMKAALLNQALIAGVGNIYADEALFAAQIHPKAKPAELRQDDWRGLATALRQVLKRAISAGGSTIRDYVDAAGANGAYASEHCVYGRGGEPCVRCGSLLRQGVVGQRTTVWCASCQTPRRRSAAALRRLRPRSSAR